MRPTTQIERPGVGMVRPITLNTSGAAEIMGELS
jgi:hypothetical protein